MTEKPGNAPFARVQMDSHWSIVEVDDAFERVTGVSTESAVGVQVEELVSRRDRKGMLEFDKQRSGFRSGLVDVVLQFSGSDNDTLVRMRATQTEGGWRAWLENLLAQGNDAMQKLNVETGWCRNVVSRSDEGIVVLGPDDTVSEINQSAMDLLAFRSDEGMLVSHEVVVGSNFFDRLPSDLFGDFADAARKAVKKKKLRFVSDVEHEGKALEVRLTSLHLPVRGHAGCTLSIRDITVQREIERVSEELRIKNEDIRVILSNLDLGIFTVEEGRTVHPEFSRRLPGLLGTETIAGQEVVGLLFAASSLGADDRARVKSALDLALGSSVFSFEINAHCFPKEFALKIAGETRSIEADWVPIESEDGTVHRVMVVLRDVTELHALRDAAAAGQREMKMIGELLSMPADAFEEYGTACHQGLDDTLTAARGRETDFVALARTVHTLKGNARAWGLKAMCDAIHLLEEPLLADARDNDALAARTMEAQDVLAAYETINTEKLNRGSGGSGGVSQTEQQLLRKVSELVSEAPESLPRELRALATAAAFLPVRPRLDALAQKLVEHAKERGKAAPRFHFPLDLLIHRQQMDLLHGAFVHLLTNAVDHGLETADERARAGKQEYGTIKLCASKEDDNVILSLRDDGRGLAVGRLREKKECTSLTREQAAAAVFDAGVSTAERVTQSSGRGMGMSAVRSQLAALGGSIEVEFDGFDGGAQFVPLGFRMVLPSTTARLLDVDTARNEAA